MTERCYHCKKYFKEEQLKKDFIMMDEREYFIYTCGCFEKRRAEHNVSA